MSNVCNKLLRSSELLTRCRDLLQNGGRLDPSVPRGYEELYYSTLLFLDSALVGPVHGANDTEAAPVSCGPLLAVQALAETQRRMYLCEHPTELYSFAEDIDVEGIAERPALLNKMSRAR